MSLRSIVGSPLNLFVRSIPENKKKWSILLTVLM
jgi:hypothetical protein